mmetsp:Transcript_8439/g.21019  ORF Transcript_8439/g.21019 Transcript_8439/m.21019 type:complete len:256 (+) Transcript_8439:864-1631(+)
MMFSPTGHTFFEKAPTTVAVACWSRDPSKAVPAMMLVRRSDSSGVFSMTGGFQLASICTGSTKTADRRLDCLWKFCGTGSGSTSGSSTVVSDRGAGGGRSSRTSMVAYVSMLRFKISTRLPHRRVKAPREMLMTVTLPLALTVAWRGLSLSSAISPKKSPSLSWSTSVSTNSAAFPRFRLTMRSAIHQYGSAGCSLARSASMTSIPGMTFFSILAEKLPEALAEATFSASTIEASTSDILLLRPRWARASRAGPL